MEPAMREIVDELIYERAPWLRRGGIGVSLARRVLNLVLHYERTIKIGETLRPMPGPDLMQSLADMIALHVEVTGLENLPAEGRALVVCNHPTGIADGVVLYGALAQRRPDFFIFANADALRVMPQLESLIAPVEWRPEKRTHKQNRETMQYAYQAFGEGRLGVLFPAGRLAKRRWFSLHERPWMPSGAMLARRFNLPIVPLHITARNSALFYLFDRVHPTLRDITLFHEVLNKSHQPYRLNIGSPIDPQTLPSGSTEATEVMRQRTLELGGAGPQTVLTAPRYGRPKRLRPARLTV
jgi:putative hemolysin